MRLMRKLLAVLAVVVAGIATGCTLPRPAGDSPLRYRDAIFSTVEKTSNLKYGSAPDNEGDNVDLFLDLYEPAGDAADERPALVWAHGGSFISGDKGNVVPVDVANTFAKQGYVVVSINYRLLAPPGCASNPGMAACTIAALEAQHDAQAAVRWLRANAATYGIDPDRIAMGGESAGGITATLVGLHSDDPGASGNPGFPSTIGGFVSVSGGLPQGVFAGSGDSPGLLFHGTADRTVSPTWSQQTFAAMLRANVPSFLQLQQGAGHVPWAQYRVPYLEQANYFLYAVLDLAHAESAAAAALR
jgi:dipeptidyl aminopeptidase/acylaminoacyl peptidase